MISFEEAIKQGILKVLSKSRKNLLFGQEVTNVGAGFFEKYPKQVYETPLSEAASTGLVVGLSTQGFKPQIVYGRVEFALLAFDLIFTQAGRWQYTFGGKSKCAANFRIQIGRQWGNGPEHTANYHSIFLQAYGLDVFIPSTPQEAYNHILYMNKNNVPSVTLEHRYLTQIKQKFKLTDNVKKPYNAKFYPSKKKSKILLITYADTLIDALKAKKILKQNNIDVSILNFSYFSNKNKIDQKFIKLLNNYDNLLFIDSAPFEFGILSGLMSIINLNIKDKSKYFYLSPPNIPAAASAYVSKDYYVDINDIIKKCCLILNKKIIKKIDLTFDQKILWPNDNIEELY